MIHIRLTLRQLCECEFVVPLSSFYFCGNHMFISLRVSLEAAKHNVPLKGCLAVVLCVAIVIGVRVMS
jgi:hypothetical protein